jgi:UDP-glucose 4-epimerase
MTGSLHGRTVLVTGGLGFLGSALVRALARAGASVRVLDSLLPYGGGSPRHLDGVDGDVTVTIEDTRSRDIVNQLVTGCDLIYHCAGHDGVSALSMDWYSELDISCIGTLHVLDAVRVYAPTAHVVFTSSSTVYGPPHENPVSEDAPTEPTSIFGVHKLTGEKYCGVYRTAYGVHTTVARLATMFGPAQRLRGAGTESVAHLIDAATHDESLRLRDQGRTSVDALHVDDAVAALMALGLRQRDSFPLVNVGNGPGLTMDILAEAIVRAAGRGRVERTDVRAQHGAGLVMNVDRLRSLGIAAPTQSLDEALRATLAWYRGPTRAS